MSSTSRQMVLMFADVCGNVSIFEHMADTEATYAIDRCLKRMTRAIEGFSGRVQEAGGGELLVAFDSAEDACMAAIEMQQRVADLPPVAGQKLSVRIGLHIGEVQVTSEQLRGPAIVTAARIAGNADKGQILCSAAVFAALPPLNSISRLPASSEIQVSEGGKLLTISQVFWPVSGAGENQAEFGRDDFGENDDPHQADRICIRYRGKAFLLDHRTPVLTIGRDLSNEMFVEDRKASRLHARIEKRGPGYYLVDSSTNGTFLLQVGQREMLLRRGEALLAASGKLSFGCSVNEPTADVAEFEYLN